LWRKSEIKARYVTVVTTRYLFLFNEFSHENLPYRTKLIEGRK